MNPIAFIAYQLIGLEVMLFLLAVYRYRTIPQEDTAKRKKTRLGLLGSIALLVVTLIGSGIAIYFSVTPMYREVPLTEGHYASDVPPDEIIPLEDDYCLAIYPLQSGHDFEMGLFHSKTEDGKTLYRFETYLSLNLPWSQNDRYGWWEGDFDEFRYYHEWVLMADGFYGAVCPKDGEVVPDASHTATITREVTVDGEVYVVYIAVE